MVGMEQGLLALQLLEPLVLKRIGSPGLLGMQLPLVDLERSGLSYSDCCCSDLILNYR